MELSALVRASISDTAEIISLFQRAVEHLNHNGIPQWDAIYPHANHVMEDLANQELYAAHLQGNIAGVITLNQQFDPAYDTANWQYTGDLFAVVHRLCVAPDAQGKGVGTQMMRMAEVMLRKRGMKSIRLDAFSKNPYALRMYEKLGYSITGEAIWRKGLFYLMEKDISKI